MASFVLHLNFQYRVHQQLSAKDQKMSLELITKAHTLQELFVKIKPSIVRKNLG